MFKYDQSWPQSPKEILGNNFPIERPVCMPSGRNVICIKLGGWSVDLGVSHSKFQSARTVFQWHNHIFVEVTYSSDLSVVIAAKLSGKMRNSANK